MSPLALSLRFLQAQPDARLAQLARDGHEPAFEALVRRYRRELLAYCRRLQPRGSTAEDVLQQALLKAWTALNAGAEVREVRPWLYRIAHNVAISNMRTAAAEPAEVEDAPGGVDVDLLVEQRLQARAALASIAALPELQRQVMLGTALDGASHEELGSALGLSSGAVRGLVYRARATLRAAAAAVTPAPALHWMLRRAEARGGAPAVAEMLAGGGGAGVAGLVVKGGAVLTLAGAVAGPGVLIVSHNSAHHSVPRTRLTHSTAPAATPVAVMGHGLALAAAAAGAGIGGARPPGAGTHHTAGRYDGRGTGRSGRQTRSEGDGSGRDGHRGPSSTSDSSSSTRTDGGSPGGPAPSSGSDGGSGGGSGEGSPGGPGPAVISSGGGSDGSGSSSGGSDGGSHSGTTSTSGGSNTSGGSGPGSGSGGSLQVTTTSSGSDGGSGGGTSGGGHDGGSSSSATTTSSTSTGSSDGGH